MIQKLFYYIETGTDPHKNLALEQYLTETVEEEACVLYLWQNRHTVVIGRNQNAWKECRTTELERAGGTLARRLSGGGAVYHDLGNLNFTFCMRTANYDLRKQQRVIVEACRILGISAEISGRNDLLVGGRKFSGNSFYSHEGCSFHNGTLLLDVDMEKLEKYLSPSKAKLESKGVASVRSRVVNLLELVPDLSVERVEEAMIQAFSRVYGLDAMPLHQEGFEAKRLEMLYSRFQSWEWNYGKIVPFTFSASARFVWGEVTIELLVEHGLCSQVAVYTDAMDAKFAVALQAGLQNCRFAVKDLCECIDAIPACSEIACDLCTLLRAQDI